MAHLDALSIREYQHNGETKTAWTKIGRAFPHKKGGGYSIFLDAMPAISDGQYKIMLTEPKEFNTEKPSKEIESDVPF